MRQGKDTEELVGELRDQVAKLRRKLQRAQEQAREISIQNNLLQLQVKELLGSDSDDEEDLAVARPGQWTRGTDELRGKQLVEGPPLKRSGGDSSVRSSEGSGKRSGVSSRSAREGPRSNQVPLQSGRKGTRRMESRTKARGTRKWTSHDGACQSRKSCGAFSSELSLGASAAGNQKLEVGFECDAGGTDSQFARLLLR